VNDNGNSDERSGEQKSRVNKTDIHSDAFPVFVKVLECEDMDLPRLSRYEQQVVNLILKSNPLSPKHRATFV
jgi:hypothetical protein